MSDSQSLRVGHIPYLNCRPFFHHLESCGFRGEIVTGVPSALNRMLQSGRVDISPSSSFEYALNSHDYLLLPDLSISSQGAVKSVLLFSPCPPEKLKGQRVAITGESATSINLLRVLLLEYYGHRKVEDYVPREDVESLVMRQQPALLIGDRAMRQAEDLPTGMQAYDLGHLWHEKTGLPFVFALWILRRDSVACKQAALKQLAVQLTRSTRMALDDLEPLALAEDADRKKLIAYWQAIDYRLTLRHLEGLLLFCRLCHKHGLLKEVPVPEFFAG